MIQKPIVMFLDEIQNIHLQQQNFRVVYIKHIKIQNRKSKHETKTSHKNPCS
jgi:hypothetical protein